MTLYVLGYALIRWLVESTRGDDRGPLFLRFTATEWIAAACLLIASGLWIGLRRRERG